MAQFKQEHKTGGTYFTEGNHKVKIDAVEFGETQDGKEYAEIQVLGENGEKGSARVWFTTDGAMRYAFSIIKSIFVMNTPAANRAKIEEQVDGVQDTEQLAKLCEALRGKDCWYQVQQSDRTYVNKSGERRHSFDTNVYGYEPKPVEKRTDPGLDIENGEPFPSNDESGDDPFPFGN